MAENDWIIGLTAGLDKNKSKVQIKKDIDELQKAINKFELQAVLDVKTKENLEDQLSNIKIALTDVSISDSAINKLIDQINSTLSTINISGLNIKDSDGIVHHLDEIRKVSSKVAAEEEKTLERMAKVREKTELARQSEEKRQQLAQNNAINKALEEEYAEREKLAQQVKTILEKTGDKGKTTTDITLLRDNFTKLGLSADEVKNKMSGVDKEYSQLKMTIASGDNSAIVSQFNKVNAVLSQTQNDLELTRSEYSQYVSMQQRLSKANVIEAWNQKNSKATSDVRATNEAYIVSLRDLNTQMTKMQFNEIVDGFKRAENSMRGINRLGASIKDQFKQAFQTISQGMSVVNVVRTGINYVQQMPSIVTELDTALVDLRKTADMTNEELDKFYYSNDIAKQMGVTTNEILNQAAAWSRLNKIGLLYGNI